MHALRRCPARPGAFARVPRVFIPWLALLATLLLSTAPLRAQPVTSDAEVPNVLVDITVEGNRDVERGQVLSAVGSKVGLPVNPEQVTQDIQSIFDLGFFQDVRALLEPLPEQGGYRLVFRVKEKPRVVSLDIEGNRIINDTKLLEDTSFQIGSVYSTQTVQSLVDHIRGQYRDKGYIDITVRSEVRKRTELDYALTLVVEEQPRVYITDIRTHNNEVFTELEIRRIMSTAEVDCFDWVNDSGKLDEQKVNQDLQNITSEYLRNGYIKVFIEKPAVKIIHNRDYSVATVDLTVSEGQQYFTGEVDISGDILGDKQELLDAMRLEEGEVYNPFLQNQDTFVLNQHYQEQGYAFVRVTPQTQIHEDTRTVDVTYNITQGDKAYIGRIEFRGNRETRDYVMRREFEVRENELYNGVKLRRSQENLRQLGYFEPGLNIQRQRTDVGNVLDVVTEVKETQTGTLQAQVGYSDRSKLSVSASVSKGNLFGRGQTIRFKAEGSQEGVTRNFQLDFIEPHLFGSEYSSDTSLNYSTEEDISELDRGLIIEQRATQGFGHPLYRDLRYNITFETLRRDFKRGGFDAVNLQSITQSITYDTVNHPVFSTAGSNVTLSFTQVGGVVLGGTTQYRRYRFRAQRFLSLDEESRFIVMGRLRLGLLEPVGDYDIPREDRFRLGGISTVRGYDFAEIGGPYGSRQRGLAGEEVVQLDENGQPVLDDNGNPVTTVVDPRTDGLSEEQIDELRGGGVLERVLNLELLFPLAGNNIRGVVFYDAGNVNAEKQQYRLLGEEEPAFLDLLQSVGGGIRMITPLGVFRFEYGIKLDPEKGEDRSQFDFTISTLF